MLSALFPFLAYISFPVSKSLLDIHRTVATTLFGMFISMYFFLWIVTLGIGGIVWRRKITRRSTCATPVKSIVGSTCAQCRAEVTPWAMVEWIGEFDLSGERGKDETATELRADRASSEQMEAFGLQRVPDLAGQMITDIKGEEMTADSICHVYDGRYSRNECLEALLYLESIEAIVVEPALKLRDSAAIPENALIYFPINTSSVRRTLRVQQRTGSAGATPF
jgi:hypothetical protein